MRKQLKRHMFAEPIPQIYSLLSLMRDSVTHILMQRICMRVLSNVEQAQVPAGLAPLLIGAAKCVVGADFGMAAYGTASQISGSPTSGCGAVVSGIAGCVGAVVNPFAGAVATAAGTIAVSLCDKPNNFSALLRRCEGSSRDPSEENYENEMDRGGR